MKILANCFDYKPLQGGVAEFSYQLLAALSRQGMDIHAIAPAMPGDAESDTNAPFAISRYRCPRRSQILSVLVTGAMCLRHAIRHRPNLLLNFIWLPSAAGAWVAAPALALMTGHKVKTATIVYADEILDSSYTLKKRIKTALAPLRNRILGSSDLCVAISCFTRDQLLRCSIPPERIAVINPGIAYDTAHDASRARSGEFTLLSVARLVDYKGIDKTLHALVLLRQRGRRLRYVIAGDGPFRSALEQQAFDLNLSDVVVFAGSLSRHALNTLYSQCDVFVLPSRFEPRYPSVEGFGIVFLEANSFGKPVIGGNAGGVPDAIEDGRSGLLVNPDSALEIAAAIEKLMDNPDLANAMGNYGRQRALGRFTWERIAGQYIEEFKTRGF